MTGVRNVLACLLVMGAAVALQGCAAKVRPPVPGAEADSTAVAAAEAYARGDYEAALAGFRGSLRMNRALDNRRAEAMDLVNIGRTLVMLGEYAGAVEALEEASGAARNSRDEPLLFEAVLTLAKARHLLGDSAGAGEDLEAALALGRRLKLPTGPAMNLKGQVHLDAGMYQEAASALSEALRANRAAKDASEEANSLRALAELSTLGYYPAPAMELYQRAYELDRAAGDSKKIALDLGLMAGLHGKGGRPLEAAFFYERAYVVSSSAGLSGDALRYLEWLIGALQEGGDAARAERFTRILKEAGGAGEAASPASPRRQ